MTYLEKGNKAFKAKNYEDALKYYRYAINNNGALKDILKFNISVCEEFTNSVNSLNSVNMTSMTDDEKIQVINKYLENKNKRKANIVVYTAIIGGYDKLILPDELVFDWDYVLFTDARIEGISPFEVRSPLYEDADTVRVARYHKLNSHLVLSEYDYSIWIDGNIQLKSHYFRELINDEADIGTEILLRKHPDRRCTYQEILKCRELLKDDFGLMSRQLDRYRQEKFPENAGLFETNVVLRCHKSERVLRFNEYWWEELSKGSRRDQLSCVYALRKAQLYPDTFPDNTDIRDSKNPYYSLFSHNEGANKKSLKYQGEKIYSLEKKPKESVGVMHKVIEKPTYKIDKSPFKAKRAYLKARNLGFEEIGIEELKQLSNKGSKKEQQWSSWFLALLLSQSVNRDTLLEANDFLEASDLSKDMKGFNKFKAFLAYEFALNLNTDIKIPKKYIDDDDFIASAMSHSRIVDDKIAKLNRLFEKHGLQKVRLIGTEFSYIDSIYPESPIKRTEYIKSATKVSIIVPCYKCADLIETTIYSLIGQTWLNIEIILVDDCSPDDTLVRIKELADLDSRIKVISTNNNSGPYVARNLALTKATGHFITVCDSDDWCHPQKIEYQVKKFDENPEIVATCASWIRCDDAFNLIRRGQPFYCHLNISSLMVKRDEVMAALGGWDEVRFAADGEFYKRLIKVFGRDKVLELSAVTSIGRVEPASLTNSSFFGYDGFPYGARLEYLQSYEHWHNDPSTNSFFYDASNSERPYPAPLPMLPGRPENNQSNYESILACDLRDESLKQFVIEFIYQQERNETQWSLVQVNSPLIDARRKVNAEIRAILSRLNKCISVYGETLFCDELIYLENKSFKDKPSYVPLIHAKEVTLICNDLTSQQSATTYLSKLDEVFKYEEAKFKYISPKFIIHEDNCTIHDKSVLFEDIITLRTSELATTEFSVSPLVSIVMPCIDEELGTKTAEILSSRAGIQCTVIIAMDDERNGFMKTLNSVSKKCDSRFIVFVAQDAFPGRDWLKIAVERIEQENAGLLAFNDGKWFGRIASFGLVRKSWVKKYYQNAILNPYYKAHKADNEITLLARLDNRFVYEPNSTLIEVDYRKDGGGSNPEDDLKFRDRFNSRFDGAFSDENVERYRAEYKVK